MLQNSFSIIQIEISSLALSKHVEIQPEPFSSIERDLWRYALRVNQSIRRFQALLIEENFQSSALRNELQTLENTPDCTTIKQGHISVTLESPTFKAYVK